ncbi:response regulator [Desulfovibrio mangrovi]|uniref:response regulator n=1 Tax=Desulfovibrio mangrovi TaxID=2976983 RepID=UPI0022463F5B|nr:HD domain-containing phosphohydrolase [Desulfovibrio mangrovi]UZP67772.1 response regulator [Desulfovibrio mangrovi]
MTAPQRILIVDDTPANIHILKEVLKDEFAISAATNGKDALKLASSDPRPDIILLDIVMSGMDGYEVCKQLKRNRNTAAIPILFVTTLSDSEDEARGLELGAVDYITKPFSPPTIKARVRNHLKLKEYQDNLEHLVEERTREIALTQSVTIFSMACLAEMRDNELVGHIKRTQLYVRLLAEQLEHHVDYRDYFRQVPVDLLCASIPLHDIGKIGIPDQILLKPGRLNDDEFAIMKLHTVYGRDTLERAEGMLNSSNSFLRVAREIAHTHHEWWDGSGYPQGLAGTDIPVAGRLMAVADVYDALISKRIYKEPISHQESLEIVANKSGTQFDPQIIEAFVRIEKDIRSAAIMHADFEEERQCLLNNIMCGTDCRGAS